MTAADTLPPGKLFRTACSRFATGVTAVTAIDASGEVAALTVNSFTSVSLDPPQVLVCIAHTSSSFRVMSKAERLAVHILSESQEEIARRLATAGLTGEERLAEIGWAPGPGNEPHLSDVASRLAGRVVNRLDSGDHLILLVEVDHVEVGAETGVSLVFVAGRFLTIDAASAPRPS